MSVYVVLTHLNRSVGRTVAAMTMTARDRARLSPIGLAHAAASPGQPYQARAVHQLFNTTGMLAGVAAMNPSVPSPWRNPLVAVSPRSGKSLHYNILLPVWLMGTYARTRSVSIAIISAEAGLAESFSRDARNLMHTLGPTLWGVDVDPRSSAVDEWSLVDVRNPKNSLHSIYRARGIGGALVGVGLNVAILDDVYANAAQAQSKSWRDQVQTYYDAVVRSRLEAGAATIVIGQRWNGDDIFARLVRQYKLYSEGGLFTPIVVPFQATEDGITSDHVPGLKTPMADLLRREPGQIVWPGRLSEEDIDTKLKGKREWFLSQYQQMPIIADEDAPFQRERFLYYEDLQNGRLRLNPMNGPSQIVEGARSRRVLSIDLASSMKDRADWTVILTALITPDNQIIVTDVTRKRVVGVAQENLVVERYLAEGKNVSEVIYEKVAFQMDFGSRMSSKGLPMRGYDPRGMDKMARAISAAAKIEAGRVFFPHNAPWLSEFLSELESFPGGRWDDQCDAFAQLLAYMDKKALTDDSIRLIR